MGEKPHPDYDLADWVLGKFSREDLEALREVWKDVPAIAELFVRGELDLAMSRYNRSGRKAGEP